MLVRTKHSNDASVATVDDGQLIAYWHEVIATPWLHQYRAADASWFTIGCVDSDVSLHPWVQEADVLHLHWVAEWLSADAIHRLLQLGKPVLWSFHDLWPVSCGNHYAGGQAPTTNDWQTGAALPPELTAIGQREFMRKMQSLADQHLQVIAPSRWIGHMAQQSEVGRQWPVHHLPYGINTQLFQPKTKAVARQELGLPTDKILLLFSAASLAEKRKGFHLLVKALQQANLAADTVQLLLAGSDELDLSTLPVAALHLGNISTEQKMALIYQAADAYLCPTLEDNLPNTVIESLCSGTPVIGFSTGGLPDLISHSQNGLLASCGDVDDFSHHLNAFCTDSALRDQLLRTASTVSLQDHALETQATRMLKLYEALPATSAKQPTTGTTQLVATETEWLMHAVLRQSQQQQAREHKWQAKLEKLKAKQHRSVAPPTTKKSWWKL
jgi:glycosyltransferase involved in cell wall biosynthesis